MRAFPLSRAAPATLDRRHSLRALAERRIRIATNKAWIGNELYRRSKRNCGKFSSLLLHSAVVGKCRISHLKPIIFATFADRTKRRRSAMKLMAVFSRSAEALRSGMSAAPPDSAAAAAGAAVAALRPNRGTLTADLSYAEENYSARIVTRSNLTKFAHEPVDRHSVTFLETFLSRQHEIFGGNIRPNRGERKLRRLSMSGN